MTDKKTEKKIIYSEMAGKNIIKTLAELHAKFSSFDEMLDSLINMKFILLQSIDPDNNSKIVESKLAVFGMPDCDCPSCQNLQMMVIESILNNEDSEQIDAKIELHQCTIETMQ